MYKLFVLDGWRLCLNPQEVAYWRTTFGMPPELLRAEVEAKLRRLTLLGKLRFILRELFS